MLEPGDLQRAIADPFVQTGVLAAIGAVVTRPFLRNHPQRRLGAQLAFFAALTALLFYHGIVPYDPVPAEASVLQRLFIGLAKIVWWMNATWSLTSFVRVVVVFDGQPREGRLMQDLVVGVSYVAGLLCVVAYVFNAPVGTLIATSGVIAIIVGLALQSTLGDVFSGIALNIGQPYGIGDRLSFGDGIEGLVVETNWRATHLLNAANDLVVVPNSDLAKARLTNLSSPQRNHGSKVTVRFAPTVNPASIVDVMRYVILSANTIQVTPQPTVLVKSMDATAIEVELWFLVGDVMDVGTARNEIFDLIFRHAKSANLILAPPAGAAVALGALGAPGDRDHRPDITVTPLRLLDVLPLFSSLTDAEREALAATVTRRTFRKNDIVAEQDETLHALMIIRKGVVSITRREDGRELELGRFAPGDSFGERGLLAGTGEAGTIRALTRVVVYEIAQESLGALIRDRPALADELGAILARRSEQERHLFDHSGDSGEARSEPRIVARIRQLFGIPHGV